MAPKVVWKASRRLGCGKGKASMSGMAGDYWVRAESASHPDANALTLLRLRQLDPSRASRLQTRDVGGFEN